jgi:hypothetical protein
MNCPECGNKMEQESCPYVTGGVISDGGILALKTHKVSSTHYYCEECDSEWAKTTGKIRKLDGAEQPLTALVVAIGALQDRVDF